MSNNMPPAGNFLFVLVQDLVGKYTIRAGLAAKEAISKDEMGLLEGAVLSAGEVEINNQNKEVLVCPYESFLLPVIKGIMDDYASRIGYKCHLKLKRRY